MVEDISAKDRYATLDGDRTATLDRAILCAEVTIPYLFRDSNDSAQDDLKRGYAQGYGAKLVNHLTGKFALSILPPSQSFYRLSAGLEAMDKITGGDQKAKQVVERVLADVEDGIMRYINNSKFRDSLYPALRLAMVTGESMIEKIDDKNYKVFNLNNYVVKRDSSGNVLHLIIKEVIDYDAIPEDLKSKVTEEDDDAELELYTHVYNEEGTYNIYQEIESEKFNESTIKNFNDKFISVRWNKVDGEDYARSFVEEHLGSFISLEKMTKVLNESAVISSKTVFTNNPNGMTRIKDFTNAKNGDVIVGQESDIGIVRVQKGADLQLTYNLVQDLKKELAEAFLLGSASIRDAERVTAHEVQMVASELEASFGGIYTAIASDIQMPIVENAISVLKVEGMEDIDIIITAGVEALGRSVEQAKTNRLIQDLMGFAQLVGAETVSQSLNSENIVYSMVINSGVGNKDFVKTIIEQEAEAQANAENQITEQVVAGGANQLGQNMANQAIQQ